MNQLTIHKNIPLYSGHNKPIVTDFIFKNDNNPKSILIFCHGYKGYKDWGAWPLLFEKWAAANFFVVAFNFSHNGGTLENPIDFPDLEAFGNDNFSIQQNDLQAVIDEVLDPSFKFKDQIDSHKLSLVGHSRGGGVCILKAATEQRITALVTLASISDYADSLPSGEALKKWKEAGVTYVLNGRTKQQMPLYYQLYEDYISHKKELNIPASAEEISVPHLIIHGSQDPTVPLAKAQYLHTLSAQSDLHILETDHVFDSKHPWEKEQLPEALENIANKVVTFLNEKQNLAKN